MYYFSERLAPVPVPPVENPGLHRVLLFGIWAGYTAAIDVGVYLAVRFLAGPMIPQPHVVLNIALFLVLPVAVVAWVFVLGHNAEARNKRWRKKAYPIYSERTKDARAWSWRVKAAAPFDDKWLIVMVRRDVEGAEERLLTLPESAVVDLVAGITDSIAFSDIVYTAGQSPGGRDRIMFGGVVTITYDSDRGGPPPIQYLVPAD